MRLAPVHLVLVGFAAAGALFSALGAAAFADARDVGAALWLALAACSLGAAARMARAR